MSNNKTREQVKDIAPTKLQTDYNAIPKELQSYRSKPLSGKTKKVAEWLLEGKTITSMQAIQMFGTTRLPAIIHNLRGYGYPIETNMIEAKDRYGEQTRFGEYKIKEVEQ